MLKVNRMLRLITIASIATIVLFPVVQLPVLAASPIAPLKQQDEPPLGSRYQDDSLLAEVVTLLAEDEPPLGSRSSFCALTPGVLGETDVVWSDRPLFLWQGQAQAVILSDFETQVSLWSQEVAPTAGSVVYGGAALEPGQVYSWRLSSPAFSGAQFVFEVMPLEQRDRVTAELEALVAQYPDAPAETIALVRSKYFAEQGLASDALQMLYEVENPSVELVAARQAIVTHFCGAGEEENGAEANPSF
jgi:hypothetical protein